MDILTPDQAAEYLQVNRETVYRYIRDGKLMASRLGRSYRITQRSIEQLLETTQVRSDITPRTYSNAQVAAFLEDDRLDEETRAIIASLQVTQSSHDG